MINQIVEMKEAIIALGIFCLFLIIAYYVMFAGYMYQYIKRKRAEIYIQLEGEMEDYEEFLKYF
jgi:hypothetical protein